MKSSLIILLLSLSTVICTKPVEHPLTQIKGRTFVNSQLQNFIESVHAKSQVKQYFGNLIKYLQKIQDINQELVNHCNGIANQLEGLSKSIKEQPSKVINTNELTVAAQQFYDKSYRNYYLISHGINWLLKRSEALNPGDLKTAIIQSYLSLEYSQHMLYLMADIPRNEVHFINKCVSLTNKYEHDVEKVIKWNTFMIKKLIINAIIALQPALFNPTKYTEETNNAVNIIVQAIK